MDARAHDCGPARGRRTAPSSSSSPPSAAPSDSLGLIDSPRPPRRHRARLHCLDLEGQRDGRCAWHSSPRQGVVEDLAGTPKPAARAAFFGIWALLTVALDAARLRTTSPVSDTPRNAVGPPTMEPKCLTPDETPSMPCQRFAGVRHPAPSASAERTSRMGVRHRGVACAVPQAKRPDFREFVTHGVEWAGLSRALVPVSDTRTRGSWPAAMLPGVRHRGCGCQTPGRRRGDMECVSYGCQTPGRKSRRLACGTAQAAPLCLTPVRDVRSAEADGAGCVKPAVAFWTLCVLR
jgi:hypothetical protein